jgi:hypothetical protein
MMTRPQKPFGAESAKAYAGAGGLRQYFTVEPKPTPLIMGRGRGRPSKKRKMHLALGDKPVDTIEREEQQYPPPVANGLFQKKNTHINWRKGEHCDLMEKAIHDWHKMAGNNNNVEACCKCYKFAKRYGIPPQTFYKYVKPNNP